MALTTSTSSLTSKSIFHNSNGFNSPKPHQPSFCFLPIRASKSPSTSTTTHNSNPKWSLDSWKAKKALQQPEYLDPNELNLVLKTLESFPPIVCE
ncbi:unnamed protein product [Amaranthus hypochondriacus]